MHISLPFGDSAFDLVVCLYVHVASSVDEMVRRMAGGVAPGGLSGGTLASLIPPELNAEVVRRMLQMKASHGQLPRPEAAGRSVQMPVK